jgi:hypothetical protein
MYPAGKMVTNDTNALMYPAGKMVTNDGVWAHGTTVNITRQVWAKNITVGNDGAATQVAVLLLNAANATQSVNVSLASIGLTHTAGWKARDVWGREDIGDVVGDVYVAKDLGAFDSAFVTFRL